MQKRVVVFSVFFIVSLFCFAVPAFASEISDISFIQEGEGAPSLDNIRPIVGQSSVSSTVVNDEGEVTYTVNFPETVYGGSYDWAKGELTVTYLHKRFVGNVAEGWRTWGVDFSVNGNTGFYSFPNDLLTNPPLSSIGNDRSVPNVCNILNPGTGSYGGATAGVIGFFFGYTTPYVGLGLKNESIGLDSGMSNAEAVSAFNAYLSQHPLEYAYELAQPRTIQLSSCTNHDWEESEHTDSTCTVPGHCAYVCSVCGMEKSVVPPLVEHTWEETGRVDSSYDFAGSITYTCSVCNETKMQDLPLLPGPTKSISTLLSVITDVFSLFVSYISDITVLFISNPVLLAVVVFCFISIGIFLYKRILRF